MAKPHHFHVKEKVAEDAGGVVHRAYDQANGHKVALRKYIHLAPRVEHTREAEALTYQVAVERLLKLNHPSLRRIDSAGIDPKDGVAFLSTRWHEAEPLPAVLKQTYLSVEMATKLLSQLLEASELISYLLGEDGLWVETDSASIGVTATANDTRFVFWPAPVKCLAGIRMADDVDALIPLVQGILGWDTKEVDERRGGHLYAWLTWLKDDADREQLTIRELRETLAASAGVDPPAPIERLVSEATRKRSMLEKWPSLSSLAKIKAPKMPLFAFLSVLFVVQSIVGWIWIRKVSEGIDKELKKINLSIYDSPYTIHRKSEDPNHQERVVTPGPDEP